MNTDRPKLSVIVPTGNRKDVIEDCLQSVRWADELIVVDSYSTDGTLEIAQKYADRILQNEYGFSAKQKNLAIPQATHEWILLVDTDERISLALRSEIEKTLASNPEHGGFRIPRMNLVLGKPIFGAGYYPDYQIRLFHRDKARYQLRLVHAHMLVDGTVGTLQEPIIHYSHRSLNQTLANLLELMTTWEADERYAQQFQNGQKLTSFKIAFNLISRSCGAWFLKYFIQGGWRDGMRGLIVSIIWSMYISITYMKIWEKHLNLPNDWWEDDWEIQQRDNPCEKIKNAR